MVLDVRNLVPGQTKTMLGKTEKSNKKSSTGLNPTSDNSDDDSVEITGQANKISHLIAQMKAEPAVDPDRVSPVKEKLTKGDYQIEYERVANKMLDFESNYYGY
jgi:negative regulator of flagellin synthesis FlgM